VLAGPWQDRDIRRVSPQISAGFNSADGGQSVAVVIFYLA
jgi:hypothetical protein